MARPGRCEPAAAFSGANEYLRRSKGPRGCCSGSGAHLRRVLGRRDGREVPGVKRDLFDILEFPMQVLLVLALIGIAVEIAAHLGNLVVTGS